MDTLRTPGRPGSHSVSALVHNTVSVTLLHRIYVGKGLLIVYCCCEGICIVTGDILYDKGMEMPTVEYTDSL